MEVLSCSLSLTGGILLHVLSDIGKICITCSSPSGRQYLPYNVEKSALWAICGLFPMSAGPYLFLCSAHSLAVLLLHP
jgi:hypothetical protein